jgi:hypothetical protein
MLAGPFVLVKILITMTGSKTIGIYDSFFELTMLVPKQVKPASTAPAGLSTVTQACSLSGV